MKGSFSVPRFNMKRIKDSEPKAPRITPEHVNSKVTSIRYITGDKFNIAYQKDDEQLFGLPQLTICILTLENGFTVTGESACVSPENFDPLTGQRKAFEKAHDKIYMLEGYLLKENLYRENLKEYNIKRLSECKWLSFHEALELLNGSYKLSRAAWPEGSYLFVKDLPLSLKKSDGDSLEGEASALNFEFTYKFVDGPLEKDWNPHLEDITSSDWFIVN